MNSDWQFRCAPLPTGYAERNEEKKMKYFLLIPIFIMVFIGCNEVQLQNATEKKENRQIEKNLTKNDDIKIKPHALWDSEQNYIWNRLINSTKRRKL